MVWVDTSVTLCGGGRAAAGDSMSEAKSATDPRRSFVTSTGADCSYGNID